MYSCGASPTKMGEEVRIIQNMIDYKFRGPQLLVYVYINDTCINDARVNDACILDYAACVSSMYL